MMYDVKLFILKQYFLHGSAVCRFFIKKVVVNAKSTWFRCIAIQSETTKSICNIKLNSFIFALFIIPLRHVFRYVFCTFSCFTVINSPVKSVLLPSIYRSHYFEKYHPVKYIYQWNLNLTDGTNKKNNSEVNRSRGNECLLCLVSQSSTQWIMASLNMININGSRKHLD